MHSNTCRRLVTPEANLRDLQITLGSQASKAVIHMILTIITIMCIVIITIIIIIIIIIIISRMYARHKITACAASQGVIRFKRILRTWQYVSLDPKGRKRNGISQIKDTSTPNKLRNRSSLADQINQTDHTRPTFAGLHFNAVFPTVSSQPRYSKQTISASTKHVIHPGCED